MRHALVLFLGLAACGGGGGGSPAILPPPDLTGTWSGTIRSFVTVEQYGAIVRLQAASGGAYIVSGTIASSPCFSSVSGGTSAPSGGQFSFRGDGGLVVNVTPDSTGQRLDGSYRVEGAPPCGGDRGAVQLTRQPGTTFLYVEQFDLPDLTIRLEVLGAMDALR